MPRIEPTPTAKMAAVPPTVIQTFAPLAALLAVSESDCGLVVRAASVARLGTTRLICSWLFSKEVRNKGRAMPETTLRMKAPTTVPARPRCPPMTDATAAAAPPAMTWTGLRPKPFLAGTALPAGPSASWLPRLVIVRQSCQCSRFCGDGSRDPPKGVSAALAMHLSRVPYPPGSLPNVARNVSNDTTRMRIRKRRAVLSKEPLSRLDWSCTMVVFQECSSFEYRGCGAVALVRVDYLPSGYCLNTKRRRTVLSTLSRYLPTVTPLAFARPGSLHRPRDSGPWLSLVRGGTAALTQSP